MLGIPARLAIDGVILWGAGADVGNQTRCEIFGAYVASTLGPSVAKWVNMTSVLCLKGDDAGPLASSSRDRDRDRGRIKLDFQQIGAAPVVLLGADAIPLERHAAALMAGGGGAGLMRTAGAQGAPEAGAIFGPAALLVLGRPEGDVDPRCRLDGNWTDQTNGPRPLAHH
jgi:hypothetical protein